MHYSKGRGSLALSSNWLQLDAASVWCEASVGTGCMGGCESLDRIYRLELLSSPTASDSFCRPHITVSHPGFFTQAAVTELTTGTKASIARPQAVAVSCSSLIPAPVTLVPFIFTLGAATSQLQFLPASYSLKSTWSAWPRTAARVILVCGAV